MRSKNNVTWILIASLLPYTKGSRVEGDICIMKFATGVCTLPSQCPELEAAVKSGRVSTKDIVSCGFTTREEIICCPRRNYVSTDNEILSQKEKGSYESEDLTNKQNPSSPAGQMPNSVDNSGSGWDLQRPQHRQTGSTVNFPTNSGNHLHDQRSQWNVGGINLTPQSIQNSRPAVSSSAVNNENYNNYTLDIISAKKKDGHLNENINAIFGVSSKITTPTHTPTDDAANDNLSHPHGVKDFRYPGQVGVRPTWSIYRSNDDVDPETPRTTKRTTTTTSSPFESRFKDRAAVIACREIDEGLDPAIGEHILGGTQVELREFPHMAAIGFSKIGDSNQGPYDFRCGGTLIAKSFVLTAAHCVNSRESKPAIVLLGLVNLKNEAELSDAQEIRVKKVHIYPDYASSGTYHDVAILELEHEVKYTDLVYPTCLYTDLNDPPQNSSLFVTGWGKINTGTSERSDILLKAELDIVSVSQCNASFVQMGLNRRIANGVVNTQLCAHDPGFKRDACQGDSGGPLNLMVDESLRKYRIVGIVSAGFSCGSATPGLYARVASYLDYIESIVWPHLA